MYFLLTAGVFIAWFYQNGYWNVEKTIEAVLSFTMTKALFSKYYFAGIPQGWTLTLEEMFYLTAPLYFFLIRRSKWFLAILPAAIFASGLFLKDVTNVPENIWGFLQYDFFFNIFEFFAGIALAILMLKKKLTFSKNWVTWFGLFIIISFVCSKSYLSFESQYALVLELIFLSVFGIVPLLWGLIHEKTILQKLLASPIFVLLEKSSYVFYLIHKGFIPVFMNDYSTENKLIIFILLNIVSILMFTYLEEPLNHLIRRKFNSKKALESN